MSTSIAGRRSPTAFRARWRFRGPSTGRSGCSCSAILSATAHTCGLSPCLAFPPKLILDQFGLGDLEVPNPTESAVVRAGFLQLGTWMLRTDLAAAIEPQLLGLMIPGFPLPIYPHRILANPTFFLAGTPPLEDAIGVAAQSQIADLFTYGWIPNPNQCFTGLFAGLSLFQIPIPLPDQLNFLRIAP